MPPSSTDRRTPSAQKFLEKMLAEGLISTEDSVLTVCASHFEHGLFQRLGFKDVVITNLDDRVQPGTHAPYRWDRQDAMSLSYPDKSFDWCFVHAGLHHCDSPHRALLEIYRVAKKGLVAMEARDSLAMRAAIKLGLTSEYELPAVVGNHLKSGGVNNTEVPNFIYRWTEREFIKTISSYDPTGKHFYRFYYGLTLPFESAAMQKNPLRKWALHAIHPFFTIATHLFPKQMNQFAMVAIKPRTPTELWPWLELKGSTVALNKAYVEKVYHPREARAGTAG